MSRALGGVLVLVAGVFRFQALDEVGKIQLEVCLIIAQVTRIRLPLGATLLGCFILSRSEALGVLPTVTPGGVKGLVGGLALALFCRSAQSRLRPTVLAHFLLPLYRVRGVIRMYRP